MIRFLRSLTIFLFCAHVCLPLISCTSTSNNDDVDSGTAPIEDGDIAGAEPEKGGAAAADDNGDLDNELAASTPEENKEQATANEDSLENELSDNDLDNKAAPEKQEQAQITPDDELPPLDEPATPATPPADLETPTPVPAKPVAEKPRVRDIRYLSNTNGGTVVIETSQPVSYQTRLNRDTQQFVIEMSGVELPESLKRPFNTKEFNSRIGSINAYQDQGSDTARVVVQLSGKLDGEPVIQQEGNSLVVIPPSAPAPTVVENPSHAPTQSANAPGTTAPLAARTLDEFLTGNQKFYGRSISLQVKDADVRDVINFLAEESGANIVMSDDVKGKISLKLRHVPWDQALVTLMRAKELGYVRQTNVLRISSLKSLQAETEAANKIIEAGKALVPAVVQVIPISYANMDDISKNLTPFLSKDGRLLADQRTNTLIVTDKAEVVDRVQKIVKTLDIPPAQVSIESKIVEAMEEFESFVGINWGFTGADVPLSTSGGAQGAPVNLNWSTQSASLSQEFAGAGPFTSALNIGTLDVFGDLTATLTLAEQDSLAKVISAPRISSMNREKSTILQKGENVSVVTTRAEQTGFITKTEKRTPFTLELDVTPQITNDGSVMMELDVKREFLGPVVDKETQSRAVNTREAKTKIRVHNGQTAVIGGIYTSDELESSNGIPGLMHIPILGWLFKNTDTNRTKNELLIFLTPRIIAEQEDSTKKL